MDFGVGILKTYVRMQNQLLQDTMWTYFQAKPTTLTFLAQICPKMDFGVGILKIWPWMQNHLLQNSMCANFQAKWITDFFGPNLSKKAFWGWNFEILILDWESAPPIYHVCQFSSKMDNFEFFWPKFGEFNQLRAIFWFLERWGCWES